MTNCPDCTLIPTRQTVLFDVMIDGRYYHQIKLNVAVGVEYTISELKSFARMKLPSLANREFSMLPTDNRSIR